MPRNSRLANPHRRTLGFADFALTELQTTAAIPRIWQTFTVPAGRAIALGHANGSVFIAPGVAAAGDFLGVVDVQIRNASGSRTQSILRLDSVQAALGAADPRLRVKYLPKKSEILYENEQILLVLTAVANQLTVEANSLLAIDVTEWDVV